MNNPSIDDPFVARLRARLAVLYPPTAVDALAAAIPALIERRRVADASPARPWSERDALLIAYGDSVRADGHAPLAALDAFMQRYGERFSWLHLLPFYPYSSDDGFAVIDYRAVRPDLGGWDDIARLVRGRRLVFDGVVNHASAESAYLRGYLAGDPAYRDFFIDVPPGTDTSSVLRTRPLPLLHEYPAADGRVRRLWTTFGPDQVDFNFREPAVLLELLDILLFYRQHGAGMVRLDAIPYLWKEPGTSCAHLPQTHELIKLMRDVLVCADPGVRVLTETNAPHRDNIAYFGNGHDEAHIIYNFTLAPLLVWAVLQRDATVLTDWARTIAPVSDDTTWLNVTATHDGIGVRPTEDLLSDADRRRLVDLARARGGDWTGKTNPDGSLAPYELNLNYFDAVNDPAADESVDLQVRRFLLTQAVAIAFLGIPGVYIHSLVGSRGDREAVRVTGRARSINRAVLDRDALDAAMTEPDGRRRRVWEGMDRLLAFRAARPELSPSSAQRVIDGAGPSVFAFERLAVDGRAMIAAFHFGDAPTIARLGKGIWRDAMSNESVDAGAVALGPWRYRFLTPR